jgi:hypothetical protein
MAKQFPALDDDHTAFISAQHIFFVGSAAADGQVNVSPKGMDSLRVAGPDRILWRNLTGSGNETAGHLLQLNRMTLMWCSFMARPLILRAFGTARVVHRGEDGWDDLNGLFPPDPGARQVFDMAVTLVQTSCGYAVPFMDYRAERETLTVWADKKGADAIPAYWQEKNVRTIDGFPTGMPS